MIQHTAARRTRRAYANVSTVVTPEVRAERAAILLDKEQRRQIADAESEVARAREVLETAKNLSAEKAALEEAMTRLAELQGDTGVSKKKAV